MQLPGSTAPGATPGLMNNALPGSPQMNTAVGGLNSQMPSFNGLNTLQGTLPQQGPPQAAFDLGGLNVLNNPLSFQNMPYVQQVQVGGFTRLGNGQVVPNIQNTAYIPTTVPGSITNLQQLTNQPAASSTTLGALLQLTGINSGIVSSAGVNTTGALIPPAFGLSLF
jgi:hypothetical protein